MARFTRILSLCLFTILLCGCNIRTPQTQETTATEDTATISADVTPEVTSSSPLYAETEITTKHTPDRTSPYEGVRMETDRYGELTYMTYFYYLVGAHSTAETVTIPAVFSKMYIAEPRYGIFETDKLSLPNCTDLIIEEGYTDIVWLTSRFDAPNIQTVSLPASLTSLHMGSDSYLCEMADIAVPMAYIRYDATAKSIYGDPIMGEYVTEQDFEELQYQAAKSALFSTWENLMSIQVAQEHRGLYDIDGVLYANAFWNIEHTHLLYHPELTEMPTARLLCVPRSYPTTDGTYTVKDGTQYIHSGAIYCSKTIDRLLLPDSLLYLSPTAIIATAEHPLTIVCAHGSVAAEYVERYGEMYYLAVEYRD